MTYQPPQAPILLSDKFRHPSISPEERIESWASGDEILQQFGGLKDWKARRLNLYDETHARSEAEKLALKATDTIVNLCSREFYQTHMVDARNDPRLFMDYMEAERHWFDDAIDFACEKVKQKRYNKNGRYELNEGESSRIRLAVCSKDELHQRFRAFFIVYQFVLGEELKY